MTKKSTDVNYSALNAEKAYKLLDEIEYEGATLYDIAFENKQTDILANLKPEERTEFFKLAGESAGKSKKEQQELTIKLMEKFPNAVGTASDYEFKIRKILRMNGEKARELSELFTGRADSDFMEVVENCILYITFLRGL